MAIVALIKRMLTNLHLYKTNNLQTQTKQQQQQQQQQKQNNKYKPKPESVLAFWKLKPIAMGVTGINMETSSIIQFILKIRVKFGQGVTN